MNLSEYETHVADLWTDGEPASLEALFVMTAGLAGETGETVEVLKKFVRDDKMELGELVSELGDVLYYWVRICQEFGLDPRHVMEMNIEKLEERRSKRESVSSI